jgi:hypothetical protein
MKVDIQDVLFWMDAIRNSEDRYRTLESFWKGQVNSKIWLAENLEHNLILRQGMLGNYNIVIHGGWNGVLASLLFNTNIGINHITSVDIDPTCKEIACTVNKQQEMQGRFTAVTADMTMYDYNADIVINTSCEHLTNGAYQRWLDLVPDNALIVLQSNNYFELEEHINCSTDLDHFIKQSRLTNVKFAGKLTLPKYDRYMLIGRKNV